MSTGLAWVVINAAPDSATARPSQQDGNKDGEERDHAVGSQGRSSHGQTESDCMKGAGPAIRAVGRGDKVVVEGTYMHAKPSGTCSGDDAARRGCSENPKRNG